MLSALVEQAIEAIRDDEVWSSAVQQEEHGRNLLMSVVDNWEAVAKMAEAK